MEAGWQPDPTGRHQHRYWDGTDWTAHVADDGVTTSDEPALPAPSMGAPVAELAPLNRTPGFLMLGGAAALALGSFLPWAEVGPFSKNGVDGDGVFTLFGAIAIAVLAWPSLNSALSRGRSIASLCVGAAALLICIYDIGDVLSTDNALGIEVSVGIGLWMAALGASASLAGVFLGWRRRVAAT